MGLTVTDVGLEKKSKGHELKKHVAAIHCLNSLSLLQRKISNALLYHAYPELLLKEEHEISIKQLCKLISYQGNNHSVIKSALRALLGTVIEWNLVNDTMGTEDWTASSILASVSLQGPQCFYAYSPRMKQLLHSPSMFGKVNLHIQSRFKSSYGLALYENCIRYRGLPCTKWFEMEIFRKLMGVPLDKYSLFRDFKRRVLDKSIEEVNAYSDLQVEPEITKESRKVIKIRFNLKEKNKNLTPKIEVIESPATTLKAKLVAEYGLSASQVDVILQEYDSPFVMEKIAVIESSLHYQQGKIKNLAGYLLSALKNNFLPVKPSINKPRENRAAEETKQAKYRDLETKVEKLKAEYAIYRENMIDQALNHLTETAKKDFFREFYQSAEQTIQTVLKLQRNKYTYQTVIDSPQIKALLRQFALQSLPLLQNSLISFEEFLEDLPENKRRAWQKFQSEKINSIIEQ